VEPFIVDAHVHTGYPNHFFSPQVDAVSLLKQMDRLHIRYAVNLCSLKMPLGNNLEEMDNLEREFEQSGGRIFYCSFYDPRRAEEDLRILKTVIRRKGLKGIKIHPAFNGISADDDRYDSVWKAAADHNLPIVAHTWSESEYNPSQVLASPRKFRVFVERYPNVRFVLGHSGGRGSGRLEAVLLAEEFENVYMDFAGDIYCLDYFKEMTSRDLTDKILFGSDYPWIDPRSHLTRVFLAEIGNEAKRKILSENAMKCFRIEE